MKTPVNQPAILKRISIIILLLIFGIIGIQSQKSIHFGVSYDIESFKKALAKLVENINQDVIYESTYHQISNEPCTQVNPVSDQLIINLDASADINFENSNIWEEESDEVMGIEEWMLNEFDTDPCKSNTLLEEDVIEEEMKIEDWMLSADNWIVSAKEKSSTSAAF